MFQFQNGAIESSTIKRPAGSRNAVSIPKWCDWESRLRTWSNRQGCFNSKMVRLREKSRWYLRRRIEVSIPKWCDWEECRNVGKVGLEKFQFQNGAIESQHDKGKRKVTQSFNSKMVRLRADFHEVICLVERFQFQNGAIERLPARIRCLSVKTSFNSKMVRLRGLLKKATRRPPRCFNSKMVRLREEGDLKKSFNLKVSIPKWCDWEIAANAQKTKAPEVSIPKWCDWEKCSTKWCPLVSQVSMPKWFDLEASRGCYCLCPVAVSIPKWCDWETNVRSTAPWTRFVSIPKWCDWERYCPTKKNPCCAFQFQNGAIERPPSPCWCQPWKTFQFQNGAIESRQRIIYFTWILVSIPKWCDWEWPVSVTCVTKTCFNSKMVRLRVIWPSAGRSSS